MAGMPEETVLAAMARVYANTGWKVFPCWWVEAGTCACREGTACGSPGKHPVFAPAHRPDDPARRTCHGECGRLGHGLYDATTDLDTLTQWWAKYPLAHIGLPADLNGLAVLDIDPPKGGAESFTKLAAYLDRKGIRPWDTLTQRTGSGGTHYVFAAPEGGIKGGSNVFGHDVLGLDTRGRGGYIIVAPSGHASGGTYEWVDFFAELRPWPAILTKLMEPIRQTPKQYTGPQRPPSDKYAAAALEKETAAVASARQPGRNDQLNRSAFSLGQLVGAGLLDEHTVRLELHRAAVATGLGETETIKTILSGLRNGMAEPREVSK
jgi:hypothetical protein